MELLDALKFLIVVGIVLAVAVTIYLIITIIQDRCKKERK